MSSALLLGLRSHFSEQELLLLASASVGIAGAGGLGSNVAMLLARSGIRKLVLADGDCVEASNLNRQSYWPEDLGKPKVLALRRRLLDLDPALRIEAVQQWLTPESALSLFANCSIVVECLDNANQKARLCSALLGKGFFVVAASGIGGCGLPPMRIQRLGKNFVCVGDFSTVAETGSPPLAPRVTQAAALQADAVLVKILGTEKE